jgi:hypothetical protein
VPMMLNKRRSPVERVEPEDLIKDPRYVFIGYQPADTVAA